jgi:hypothetical protein
VPNQSILAAPGSWSVNLAPADRQESAQQVSVSLVPGQRNSYTLNERAFGAAPVTLNVIDIDGLSVPMQVRVTRNGETVTTFFSNQRSEPLPEGLYSLLVLANIATRFDIEVRGGQVISDVPLEVTLSDLVVQYPRRTLVFIAPSAELARRGLEATLDNMNTLRSEPNEGGIFVRAIYPNTPLRVPAGAYDIVIDDQTDAISLGNVVPAGETVRLSIAQP